MSSNIRNKIKRYPDRGIYEKYKLIEILNRNFIAEVAFEDQGQPFIIPMNYCNDDYQIYFHGSPESRLMNVLRSGKDVAISILEVRGIIIRSRVTDNSLQYVSAIIFGRGSRIDDNEKKMQIFKNLMNRISPERWNDTDLPEKKDLDGVEVVSVKIEDFSIKINLDEIPFKEDMSRWQGIIPVEVNYGQPISYSHLDIPEYIKKLKGKSIYR
jgi:nitroimidazol reductase NimA-like FMN-containing flavoprotein (pyridoxamine 5'-phosphate oxidase superfamily)